MKTISPIVSASIPMVPKNSTMEILLSELNACSSIIRKGQGFGDDYLPVVRAGKINRMAFMSRISMLKTV